MRRGPLPELSDRRTGFLLPDVRELPLRWVAQGKSWVVISKPSGLLSVPGSSPDANDSAAERVRARYPEATGGLVVHRLDLPTSGLMVFALTSEALSHLGDQFARRTVKKMYCAVLESRPQGGLSGEVMLPLRLDPFQRPLQIYDPLHGRRCHTRWEVIEPHPLGIRVKLWPITGRTHQLRVHAAHPLGLNAPIVGDPHYSRDARADGGPPHDLRLHLHAQTLSFNDPDTGERVEVEDPAPF